MKRSTVMIITLEEIQDLIREKGGFSETTQKTYMEWCDGMEGYPVPWGQVLCGFNHLLDLKEGDYLWIVD